MIYENVIVEKKNNKKKLTTYFHSQFSGTSVSNVAPGVITCNDPEHTRQSVGLVAAQTYFPFYESSDSMTGMESGKCSHLWLSKGDYSNMKPGGPLAPPSLRQSCITKHDP